MRSYRLVLLLNRDLKKEERQKLLDEVKKWVGKVEREKTTDLGEKKLAYPILGRKSADYALIELESDKIEQDLEKKILMQDNILRHLLVRTK